MWGDMGLLDLTYLTLYLENNQLLFINLKGPKKMWALNQKMNINEKDFGVVCFTH